MSKEIPITKADLERMERATYEYIERSAGVQIKSSYPTGSGNAITKEMVEDFGMIKKSHECKPNRALSQARCILGTNGCMVQHEVYLCQFCGKNSLVSEWNKDICPKCGKSYDVQMAQDSEE
jgi:hypothetical protein